MQAEAGAQPPSEVTGAFAREQAQLAASGLPAGIAPGYRAAERPQRLAEGKSDGMPVGFREGCDPGRAAGPRSHDRDLAGGRGTRLTGAIAVVPIKFIVPNGCVVPRAGPLPAGGR